MTPTPCTRIIPAEAPATRSRDQSSLLCPLYFWHTESLKHNKAVVVLIHWVWGDFFFYRAIENFTACLRVCLWIYGYTHSYAHRGKKISGLLTKCHLRGRIMGVFSLFLCLCTLLKFSVMSTYCLWAFSSINKSRSNNKTNPHRLLTQLQQQANILAILCNITS